MKIETNLPLTAYHVIHGATVFNYAVDARQAVGAHPNEWSLTPWSADDAAAARDRLEQQGVNLPDPVELSPEDQAAIDEHAKAVAEANERLAAFRAKKEAERIEAEQVKQDEAIVASAPPAPDPTARRPFGRKGEPTAAEKAMMEKKAAKDADDARIAKEKADVDKGAGVKISS
jgi:hypothetical protein